MSINKTWHQANKMPRNATLTQRAEWHKAHLNFCGCRNDVPKAVADYLAQQNEVTTM